MICRLSVLLGVLWLTLGQASAADKLTVLLDWFVNPNHAPLVIAQEDGIFERHGLEVELIAPADPAMPPRLVAAGQADIAITYQPDFLMQLNEDLPLVRFGTLVETPLNALIFLKDGPIKELADLEGKKVGFSVATIQTAYLSRHAGIGRIDGRRRDPGERQLQSRQCAACPARSMPRSTVIGTSSSLRLEIEGRPGVALYPEEHGVPVYDELIYVAHEDRRDDPLLARFIAAVEEATIKITNHPDEARATFMASHPDLNDELNRRAFDLTLARFAKRPAAMDVGRYERFAEFLKTHGLIDAVLPVESYAVAPR